MKETVVNHKMIALARESRGLTQTSLAASLNVSQGKISKIEQGMLNVSEDLLIDIVEKLNYPKSFFFEPESVYPPATPFHRKRKSLPRRQELLIESKANIQRIHFAKLQKAADFDSNIPFIDLDDFNDMPDQVAVAVRRYWKLPKGPIENLTELLENAGIVVILAEFETNEIDGFTLITPSARPMIFVNRRLTGDRLRFTLAHELGHIVMHKIPGPKIEDEANKFASEFLMPGEEIKYHLKQVTLQKLASLKPYWKVSMQALIMRASSLKTISENQTRYLWLQMSKFGFRTREPVSLDIKIEQPSLLRELIQFHLTELKYSIQEICLILNMNPMEFRSMYEIRGSHLVQVK